MTLKESRKWGSHGVPLLPRCLRRALADESLPTWFLTDLRLPADASTLALDASVWGRVDEVPARAKSFILGLVTYHAAQLDSVLILEGAWPPDVGVRDVTWPTRVGNGLQRAGINDHRALESITCGQFLGLPAMGVTSLLDFAVVADAVVTTSPAAVLGEEARAQLRILAEEDWTQRIRADDPRFRDVVPPYAGSLGELFEDALTNPESPRAHTIAERLGAIRERAEMVGTEPIDLALVRLLRSFGASERNVRIVTERLGWSGGAPCTLQEVGDSHGLTRERVRQIESRTTTRVRNSYLPQIERAMNLLAERAPLRFEAAAQQLVDSGLATVPFDPRGLLSAAALVGEDSTISIDTGSGGWVLAVGGTGASPVLSMARRQAGRVGVSNIEEVHAELESRGQAATIEGVSEMLAASSRIDFILGAWFWVPDLRPDRNRLRNVSRRMLAVTPCLDVATLRQGVRRRYRFMRIDLVPPHDVLLAFYGAHPEFVVREDQLVESATPLQCKDILGDAERAFVDALRASPTGLMDRAELEEAVVARGVSPSTFGVFTTYSPILDHPATNIWMLRGHHPEPAHVEALRAVLATRTRRRRTLDYGWDDDGNLWLTVEIANITTPVIGIPRAIASYVADRRFEALTQEGTPAGIVAVDESGASWGYGPYLGRRGAEPGDTLTICFDLTNGTATLSLDDAAVLLGDELSDQVQAPSEP